MTAAPHWFGSLDTVTFPGQVMAHCVLTVTVKVQGADVFPAASVAWQETVVVPTVKFDPDGGVQVTVCPGQLSLLVGLV